MDPVEATLEQAVSVAVVPAEQVDAVEPKNAFQVLVVVVVDTQVVVAVLPSQVA